MVGRNCVSELTAKQVVQWLTRDLGVDIPKRHIDCGLRCVVTNQPLVEPMHKGRRAHGVVTQNLRSHFRDCRRDTAREGWQVMRDDAVLTPTSKADIGIESNNHTLDGVAGFTVRHVIGFVARQVDVPD